ncbi:uncharacterized protein LOC111122858 [Crassostrea virginica]
MWTILTDINNRLKSWKDRDKEQISHEGVGVNGRRGWHTKNASTLQQNNISKNRKLLPVGNNGSWIFIQSFQWAKQNESRRSLERHSFFICVYSRDRLSFFIAELGALHFFSIYQALCGVSFENNAVILSWNVFSPYLCDTYHHADVLRCKSMTGEKIDVVKVVVIAEENAVGHEFETREGKIRLQAFSSLVRKLVPKPVHGEQLMCYVKGDVYLTGILKYFFIRQVFNDRGVRLGNSEYKDMLRRLSSCKRLQEGFDVSIDDFSLRLAEAGYYLTNDNRLAQCFKCGGVLQLKKFDFDPWEDHAYWHPKCPFLVETRGQEYVDKVRKRLKQQCDFNSECVFTFRLRNLAPVAPTIYNDSSDDDTDDDTDDDDDDDDYFGTESPESDYFSDDEFY